MTGFYWLSTLVAKSSQHLASDFNVVKGYSLAVCGLCFLVALASEKDDVSGRSLTDGERDGFAAVRFNNVLRAGLLEAGFFETGSLQTGFLQPNDGIIDDGEWIFGARIVGGEHNEIAALASSIAHQRAFGAIAISTAAEERNDPSLLAWARTGGAARASIWTFIRTMRDEISSECGEVAERVIGVRVVNHHREGLSAIDLLKTAGNVGESSDSFNDRFGGAVARIGRRGGGEHIVDIHSADQWGPDCDVARRHCHLKATAASCEMERLGVEVSRGKAIGEHDGTVPLRLLQKLSAVLVVHIENGGARRTGAAALEQNLLGAEVVIHGAVVVEMIASEIRKHGDVKWNSEDALLFEGVRRDFHHCFGYTVGEPFGKQLIEFERLGRGVRSGEDFSGYVVFNRANERGLASRSVQDRFDDERGRAFSVCAGDTGIGDVLGGTIVEAGAQAGESTTAMRDLRPGNCGTRSFGGGVGDDGYGAGGDGLIDETIAVAFFSLHGDENRSGLHAARIVLYSADGRITGRVSALGEDFDAIEKLLELHGSDLQIAASNWTDAVRRDEPRLYLRLILSGKVHHYARSRGDAGSRQW